MRPSRGIGLLVILALAAGCESATEVATIDGPRLQVLGTVQDGGLPHASCRCARCSAARDDPAQARRVASLGLILPGSDRIFLVDATPDIRAQLESLRALRRPELTAVDRAPLDGVLLTHAHIGHYTGLAFFGYEAVHTRELELLCSGRMAAFLEGNQPWRQLIEIGNVRLAPLQPGQPQALGDGVELEAIGVPHRDELSDTVGFIFRGPRSRVLYVPDTDGWQHWDPPIEQVVAGVDVALLDGSFFSMDELPGRDQSTIGHPLIRETMDRLEPFVASGALRVFFTHLNHSNPALDPGDPARAEIEARGFAVLDENRLLPL